jgi:hypothetical protein
MLLSEQIRCLCLAVLIVLGSAVSAFGMEVSFNQDVFPILSDRCFACHGPDSHDRKAKLRLDQADGVDGAYRTHDGVTAIKPGSIKDSELWYRITTDDADDLMPPSKANKKSLSKEEQAVIKSWIEAGAPYERFWAFVPAKKPEMPKVKDSSLSKLLIDRLVLAKLDSLNLQPSPEADKRTLIRRVSFDLTGLPPSREEIKAFLADDRPEAYEALVDRLLTKKQYGEHLARYWLDLVRFADTNGMHKDFYRNFIAYRDWVIRAFNENLGYDDFVRYQLAGDLFSNATSDQLVASAFNRLHLIIDRGTALPEESFFKNVVDRVTAVGTTFMGMTVHCATCHDHKYDPLTQKDFYSLFAFFNNIDAAPETGGRPKNGLQPPFLPLGTPEQHKNLEQFSKQLAESDNEVKELEKKIAGEKEANKKKVLSQELGSLTGKYNALKGNSDRLDREIPRVMVMKERMEVRPTHIRIRGQYDAPGELVTRNTPEFLPALKKAGETATRMDLADWFVDPSNPLTARVVVNRFWQQFFGTGLVKTSEDIGAQGEVPSHPELLDHLTVSFIESGWDVKTLIKQIVLSRTYRQSSVSKSEQFAKDPENRNLARGSRYRMDAEMIRDQILSTSGLLVNTMFGKSVKPPQPDGLWKSVTMIGERFKADGGDAIYRRSLYTYWKRGMPPPQMTILNAPTRDACIARRERTNTPAQALLLLNESEYLKAARELARKALEAEATNGPRRLAFTYETVTSKLPDEKERQVLDDLVRNLQKNYLEQPALADAICQGLNVGDAEKKAQLAAWTVLVNALYNLDITKTRE